MARILLGWELGANRGHAVRLAGLAKHLRAHGHEVVFAVRRLDAMYAERMPDAEIWQAPVSPRMLTGSSVAYDGAPAGMADILARLGLDDALIVTAMLAGWRRLFAAIRPDIVVGDFSPFLLLAARGRLPTISIGTGFSSPPDNLPAFPALLENVAGVDQRTLLDAVNAGLAGSGDGPVAALPGMFAVDRPIVATFAELDPYADARATPLALAESIDPMAKGGDGDEVFAYLPEGMPADSPLWAGLAMSKLKVRVHIARANADLQSAVAAHGLIVEPVPIAFANIAARSRLLLSHGGHGFVAAGMAAGLPQVVCHYDLEKLTHGVALARAGLGGHVSLGAIQPRPFADSLVKLHGDDAFAARARAAGPGYLERGQIPHDDAVVAAVAELV
jgi:hypothetical protein